MADFDHFWKKSVYRFLANLFEWNTFILTRKNNADSSILKKNYMELLVNIKNNIGLVIVYIHSFDSAIKTVLFTKPHIPPHSMLSSKGAKPSGHLSKQRPLCK